MLPHPTAASLGTAAVALWVLTVPTTLAPGCSSTLEPPSGDPALDLVHADPRLRSRAARAAVDLERMDLIPSLIERLGDRDEAVRFFCSLALRRLSGEDFGFLPHGTLIERQQAIARWRRWADARRIDAPAAGTTPPASPGVAPRPPANATAAER